MKPTHKELLDYLNEIIPGREFNLTEENNNMIITSKGSKTRIKMIEVDKLIAELDLYHSLDSKKEVFEIVADAIKSEYNIK